MQIRSKALNSRKFSCVGYLLLTVLVCVIGGWSVLTHISGAVVISAQIQNKVPAQIIQHASGGTVEGVFVREGEIVSAGQLLIRFASGYQQARKDILTLKFAELHAERVRLIAERDQLDTLAFPEIPTGLKFKKIPHRNTEINLFHARRSSYLQEVQLLTNQIRQIRTQIDGLETQRFAILAQQTLLTNDLSAAEALFEKGLSRVSHISNIKHRIEQVKRDLGALNSQQGTLLVKVSHLKLEIVRLSSKRREQAVEKLRALQSQESELLAEISNAERELREGEVRAPISGVVHALKVFSPESLVRPADTLMHLIPERRGVKVIARVSSAEIDQIHLHQAATLRFSAFNDESSQEFSALVSLISADVETDEASGAAYYAVELAFAESQDEHQKLAQLKAGTPVEAFINVESRRVLSYLTKPFSDYFARALRES